MNIRIDFATTGELPQVADMLAELSTLERDFHPHHDKQMRGLKLILGNPLFESAMWTNNRMHSLFLDIEFADIMRGLEEGRGSGSCYLTGFEQCFPLWMRHKKVESRSNFAVYGN